MRTLFIINQHMNEAQIEQSYLLILAMLNFDHHVNVVFTGQSYRRLITDDAAKKKWSALKIYGVDDFFELTEHQSSCIENIKHINHSAFARLKSQADFLS